MPQYCVDAHPREYAARTVHDLTPAKCPHLPHAEHREPLGWHDDTGSALGRARFWYKAVEPCVHCCDPGRQTDE
jgi:hypothetical protein